MGGAKGKTREAIADAAASLFATDGYAATSVRRIAREAGADPAMVIRHYGSKEQLFLHTMQVLPGDALRFDEPWDTLGTRIVEYVLDADDRLRSVYLELIRGSDAGRIGSALSAAHEENFVAPLVEVLRGPHAELRARLVAAMVGGLMYALWIVEDENLSRTDRADVIAHYAPALQRLITPDPAA
ncbi:MAG: TetR family transcriptional regulator [Candidatus Microbacterium phytovorans]|uniref:TetR family transcriptional regulator n=1 Tax=Candidatus Microbacterium phytovorans TaxID=3121374 RepID=A0AAJ5W1P1_9MICO|nr:TetR family transcriptional regulator [Microbacterium sp.]WEK13006.1 MAG: TetR family transcriptional regulator [Microbacterium sp.]